MEANRNAETRHLWESPGHLELYNLKEDPKENENLTEKDEETALYLLGKLERLYRSILEGKGDPLIEQEISMPIQ